MEMLFDNPLANLSGPYFLLLYGSIIVTTALVLLVGRALADRTHLRPMPPVPRDIDPFELAFLRGGEKELAQTVTFALLQAELIKLVRDGAKDRFEITGNHPAGRMSVVEMKALTWFTPGRMIGEVNNGLASHLAGEASQYQTKLENSSLLNLPGGGWRSLTTALLLFVPAFGVYKLAAALSHGRTNVLFLIGLIIVGTIVVAMLRRLPRISRLGYEYLALLRSIFEKPASVVTANGATTMSSVDPMLLTVGLFGTAMLAGSVYDDYHQRIANHSGSSCGGSSGCGSSSSCSGGSGCGGGGCGGCS